MQCQVAFMVLKMIDILNMEAPTTLLFSPASYELTSLTGVHTVRRAITNMTLLTSDISITSEGKSKTTERKMARVPKQSPTNK